MRCATGLLSLASSPLACVFQLKVAFLSNLSRNWLVLSAMRQPAACWVFLSHTHWFLSHTHWLYIYHIWYKFLCVIMHSTTIFDVENEVVTEKGSQKWRCINVRLKLWAQTDPKPDYCWIISYPAVLRLDVDYRDQSDAWCHSSESKSDVGWACGGSSHWTSAPDVTRKQILNGWQCSDDSFSNSDFVVFSKLRKKIATKTRRTQPQCTLQPPTPIVFYWLFAQ